MKSRRGFILSRISRWGILDCLPINSILASKLVEHIVRVLLTRSDDHAGEAGLVDAVRKLLSLKTESSMLPEETQNIYQKK